MTLEKQNLTFRQIIKKEEELYNLLLLADPSKEKIDEYLKSSLVFVVEGNNKMIGTVVLQTLEDNKFAEIKNISVLEEHQGKGLGTFLIENVLEIARQMNCETIYIGTANSSIGQLYLYQKLGFEIREIRKNFFIDNYSELIYENNIQAKHMIMLAKQL